MFAEVLTYPWGAAFGVGRVPASVSRNRVLFALPKTRDDGVKCVVTSIRISLWRCVWGVVIHRLQGVGSLDPAGQTYWGRSLQAQGAKACILNEKTIRKHFRKE